MKKVICKKNRNERRPKFNLRKLKFLKLNELFSKINNHVCVYVRTEIYSASPSIDRWMFQRIGFAFIAVPFSEISFLVSVLRPGRKRGMGEGSRYRQRSIYEHPTRYRLATHGAKDHGCCTMHAARSTIT